MHGPALQAAWDGLVCARTLRESRRETCRNVANPFACLLQLPMQALSLRWEHFLQAGRRVLVRQAGCQGRFM